MTETMGTKRDRVHGLSNLVYACIVVSSILMGGCSQLQVRSTFKEADASFSQGNYGSSLKALGHVIEKYPTEGDRALFEMGIIYAYPKNENKDYQRSLECFQDLLRNYPESEYRHDSERMIFHIHNVTLKDRKIAEQQAMIDRLRQDLACKEAEITTLQQKIEELEQRVFSMEKGPADKILIEKMKRRLSLLSKGSVIKAYRIALGGNPDGPKQRQGDNKTPEGTYFIDSRNMDSRYHISLHISYPNERDKRLAKERGVPPGGDIMIHGIKNGYSSVGALHAGSDWTKGCIAVTDKEIEEIERLVPNGTVVEIRP